LSPLPGGPEKEMDLRNDESGSGDKWMFWKRLSCFK